MARRHRAAAAAAATTAAGASLASRDVVTLLRTKCVYILAHVALYGRILLLQVVELRPRAVYVVP